MSSNKRAERYYEEYVYVLDFMPHGYSAAVKPSYRREPIVQGVGENFFTLLELTLKPALRAAPREKLYIGRGERDKVDRVKGRIAYESLTAAAKDELPSVIEEIVKSSEKRFVQFFNNAGPITTRMHSLELLPRIGKKHMWLIIEERRKKLFTSFEDIEKRVGIPEASRLIVERILAELKGEEKYNLFTRSKTSSPTRAT